MNININIRERSDNKLQKSALSLYRSLAVSKLPAYRICSHKHFYAEYDLYQAGEKTAWQTTAFKSTVQIPSSIPSNCVSGKENDEERLLVSTMP